MAAARLERVQRFFEALFPERHIYVRSQTGMRGLVLTTGRQVAIGSAAGAVFLWMGICTAAMMVSMFSAGTSDQKALHLRGYYERLIADRQARLNSAVAQLSDTNGSVDQIAQSTEKRHAALAMLLTQMKGEPGLAQAIQPAPLKAFAGRGAVDGMRAVQVDQNRLIAEAQTFAKSRADRLRLAFRLAGLDPAAFRRASTDGNSLGGPLIEAKDPRALAAVLDVDAEFAERIQHAATDLSDMRSLSDAATTLPFSKPTASAIRSSGFGVRLDPFTGRPAFHAGQDFAGAMATPIYSTAPGVISFTGVRNGYGNTIEIDHGRGFKTRYAHLSAISVSIGDHIALGQRIGAMGSTGRSTGPHLHYEVWVDGRVQNPERFVEAGEYVQQAN
jgi:murein DD-endopeptidase MepM/ murein hydrolase activator NlpD